MQLSSDKHIASGEAQTCLMRMFNCLHALPLPFDQNLADRMVTEILLEELPPFMFHNAIIGHVPLLLFLHASRGPIPVDYRGSAGKRKESFNGKSFKPIPRHFVNAFGACSTAYDLKALFAVFMECGLKGLIEADVGMPYLFQGNNFSRGLELARKSKFNGELPFLTAGILQSPELALCLSEESQRSATPDAYKPTLCWATEDMVLQYPAGLAPMRPLQRVEYEDRSPQSNTASAQVKRIRNIPLAQFKAEAKPSDLAVINHIALGFQAGKMTEMAGSLNTYMGGQQPGLGIADTQGRVLCEASVDFLLGFPLADGSAKNLDHSREFVEEYCPLDIIGLQALRRHKGASLHPKDTQGRLLKDRLSLPLVTTYQDSLSFGAIFSMLAPESPVRDQMMGIMTREQWVALANSVDTLRFGAQEWLVLRDCFSISSQGQFFWILPDGVTPLFVAGYKFPDDALVFEDFNAMIAYRRHDPDSTCVCLNLSSKDIAWHLLDDTWNNLLAAAFVLHRQLQSMNLWSCCSAKPTSIGQALRDMDGVCPDDPNNTWALARAAYLLNLGVDACAQAASSLEDWTVIMQLFSHVEVAPYLSIMPRRAKGRFLEGQLGL